MDAGFLIIKSFSVVHKLQALDPVLTVHYYSKTSQKTISVLLMTGRLISIEGPMC